jgi:hypothetical protein
MGFARKTVTLADTVKLLNNCCQHSMNTIINTVYFYILYFLYLNCHFIGVNMILFILKTNSR